MSEKVILQISETDFHAIQEWANRAEEYLDGMESLADDLYEKILSTPGIDEESGNMLALLSMIRMLRSLHDLKFDMRLAHSAGDVFPVETIKRRLEAK